jgi:hypothetical protein
VYLNLFDDSTIRQSHKIVGSGATTVTADANGVITISSTDTNTDTNTHYTTKLVVGASNTASANAAATNGNVYLNLFDDSTIRQSHKIVGTGGASVTSDANGVITINAPSDTHYTTKLVVGASNTASANAAATNGNVYLNLFDNTTGRESHKIVGTGGTTVTSDADGVITINSTNTENTHYTTKLVVGASSSASANAAATNGNVYLNLFDDSTIRQAHKISGTGGTTVTSDADGNITINSTATTDLSNYVTKSGSEEFTGTKTIASSAAIKSKTGSTDYGYMHRNVAFGTSSTPTSDSTYGGSGAIYMYYTS